VVKVPDRETPSRLRRALRWTAIVLAGAVAFLSLSAGTVWWYLRPVGGTGTRVILVTSGSSTRRIGEQLAAAGLIRGPQALVVAALVRGAAGRLRHGEYGLTPAQSALEIVDVLARGEGIRHRVTIPEGYTVRQIADGFGAAGLVDRERFIELALRRARSFGHPVLANLPVDSLEGYLFPDTYALPRGLGEAAVLKHLLDHFGAMIGPGVHSAARARGLTLHQLLTVASMIEREARVPDERSTIASVIYNRLERKMRLEIDATVLYALGVHKEQITFADLATVSPYNTYRVEGLPPGPIANPGLASIIAAAAPVRSRYLYYVLRPDGSHQFSRTLEEHEDAVRRYRP
jgi:UPF0755 protein